MDMTRPYFNVTFNSVIDKIYFELCYISLVEELKCSSVLLLMFDQLCRCDQNMVDNV